jgi:hypothetical protein
MTLFSSQSKKLRDKKGREIADYRLIETLDESSHKDEKDARDLSQGYLRDEVDHARD